MTVWLAAGVAFFGVVTLLALLLPISLTSSLQGRAEPSGTWAIALGLGLGPLALSAIAAAGATPFVTCHVFGRQLARVPLSRWLGREAKANHGQPKPARRRTRQSRLEQAVGRFVRSLDPVETLLSCWGKSQMFQVRSVVVELDYSFRDVALTGRILAGMYVLCAVLPEHWQINQCPSWESQDRLALAADGRFRVWPGRLLIGLSGFVLKQWRRTRRRAKPVSD